MMQRDLVLAQVSTLHDWAGQWEKEVLADPLGTAGYGEIAMLLRRVATRMACAVGVGAPSLPIDPPLSRPTEAHEVREG